MYQNDCQKFSASPPPSAPPYPSSQPEVATGIPFISTGNLQPGTEVPWSTGLCAVASPTSQTVVLRAGVRALLLGGSLRLLIKEQLLCKLSRLRSTCMSHGLCWSHVLFYRTKLRKQFTLKGCSCGDCLVHCCCETCSLCQEYRELTRRGFDMSLGWEGNMARQNRGVAMAPVVEGGMLR